MMWFTKSVAASGPSVLLVCTANICRSPMAEAVLKSLGVFGQVRSAGVHAGPRGVSVDARAARALQRRGYALERRWRSSALPAAAELQRYDLVLAMEQEHLLALRERCPDGPHPRLFLDFAPGLAGQEVPDPYFGSEQGFELVLDLLEQGAAGLRDALRRGLLLPP